VPAAGVKSKQEKSETRVNKWKRPLLPEYTPKFQPLTLMYTVVISSTSLSAFLEYDSPIPLFPAELPHVIFAHTKHSENQLKSLKVSNQLKTAYHEN